MTRRFTIWSLLISAGALLKGQNVGIGTSTPITRLHVAAGDIFVGDAAGTNGFVLHSRSWAGYDFLQISTRTGSTYEWSKGITLVRSSGNVGIGTTAPHSAALLELSATDKGFLPTRVALTSATSWWPLVGTSIDGMLVYNTATSGTGQNAVSPGYYYWRSGRWRRLSENAYAGMIQGVLASWTTNQNLTSNCYTYQYLNSYIDLPPGRWIVYSTQLLHPTTSPPSAGSIWVRTTFSDNSSCSAASSDIIGSTLMSGLLPHEAWYNILYGQVIINNTSNVVKRYYYCGCKEPYNSYNANLRDFSTTAWGENQLYALPAE